VVTALAGLVWAQGAAAQVLFQDDFEGGLAKWMDISEITLNTDRNNAHSGNNSVQLTYTAADQDAGWMWKKGIALSATGETYVRWYQKWESGFIFNPQADQKLMMIYGLNPPNEWGDTSDWRTYVHLIGTDKGSQPSELYIDHLVWTGPGQWDGDWRGMNQNVGSPYRLRTGEWECIEVMIRLNTVGRNDGAIRMWINGVLKLDYQDVVIRNNSTALNALQITGWYTAGPSRTQRSWIDDVVVSSQYVGLGGGRPNPPSSLQAQ
jgi:hypothetical protein